MEFAITDDFIVDVVSRIVIIGRNTENADYGNPYGDIFGERFSIIVELKNGRRYSNFEIFEDVDEAFMYRQHVHDHINSGGILKSDNWQEIEPRYGSDAYVKDGIEFERYLEERNAEN